jgi:hypothetical protein
MFPVILIPSISGMLVMCGTGIMFVTNGLEKSKIELYPRLFAYVSLVCIHPNNKNCSHEAWLKCPALNAGP